MSCEFPFIYLCIIKARHLPYMIIPCFTRQALKAPSLIVFLKISGEWEGVISYFDDHTEGSNLAGSIPTQRGKSKLNLT